MSRNLQNLTTALNSLPESAGLWVVPVAAHEPHDEQQRGHDEGEGEGEGKVLGPDSIDS